MEIRLARHGKHIAIVTIDNQRHLNAMTRTMLAELAELAGYGTHWSVTEAVVPSC